MMRCWQNDPDERPAFTELKNQLKDKETLHKVRIMVDMAIFFYAGVSLNSQLVIQIALLDMYSSLPICAKFGLLLPVVSLKQTSKGYYRLLSVYEKQNKMFQQQKNLYGHYIKDNKTIAKLH